MAQYNIKSSRFLKDSTALYETVMIVDQFGNITGANASNNGADTFGRARMVAPSESHIQYDMSATALTGGRDMLTGLIAFSNQQSSPVDLNTDKGLFTYQLE